MQKANECRSRNETTVEVRNIQINSSEITGERVTTTYRLTEQLVQLPNGKYAWGEKSRTVTSSKVEQFDYKLIKTTPAELKRKKAELKPILIVKLEGHYFYSFIENPSNFVSLGKHCCADFSRTCSRLSALSDKEGGCAKVRDIGSEKDITKYPFIVKGLQTFNCPGDYNRFVVIECTNCTYPTTFRPNK